LQVQQVLGRDQHAVFSGIGRGAWVWPQGAKLGNKAPAFNYNQGIGVQISQTDFLSTARAFAVFRTSCRGARKNPGETCMLSAGRVRLIASAVALAATAVSANAQEGAGDLQAGRAYAQRVCSPCHRIEPDPHAQRMFEIAPDFQEIANTSGMTATALSAFLHTSHPKMPNFILSPEASDDVIKYILSLRDQPRLNMAVRDQGRPKPTPSCVEVAGAWMAGRRRQRAGAQERRAGDGRNPLAVVAAARLVSACFWQSHPSDALQRSPQAGNRVSASHI
jgi:mono/diheme cytochrome c family protein